MGWGSGVVEGRDVGYSVEAECDYPGCNARIDRGLGYVCGDMHGSDEISCNGYFCHDHLSLPDTEEDHPSLCAECCKIAENDDFVEMLGEVMEKHSDVLEALDDDPTES